MQPEKSELEAYEGALKRHAEAEAKLEELEGKRRKLISEFNKSFEDCDTAKARFGSVSAQFIAGAATQKELDFARKEWRSHEEQREEHELTSQGIDALIAAAEQTVKERARALAETAIDLADRSVAELNRDVLTAWEAFCKAQSRRFLVGRACLDLVRQGEHPGGSICPSGGQDIGLNARCGDIELETVAREYGLDVWGLTCGLPGGIRIPELGELLKQ